MDRTNTLTLLGGRAGGGPYIELLVGRDKGKVYELSRDLLSIGRSEESDIHFPSDAVSRIHAYLSRQETGWFIRDNGSKNGVQVNGSRAEEKALESGDLIQVGDFVFRFMDPRKARAKAKGLGRKVDLSPGAMMRAKAVPSPVWFFGAIVGGMIYFLLAPAPKRAAVRPELVISAPVQAPVKPAPPQPVAEPKMQAAVEKPPVPKVVAETKPSEADGVRPITKGDLAIKTGKRVKKVEPGKTLQMYLEEGKHYLAQGDFDSAVLAFNFAILIDPRNEAAISGMQAAQARQRDVSSVPAPQPAAAQQKAEDKKALVAKLFLVANAAINDKKYQKAIDSAEEARKIEIKGETAYINEAKQLIDRARMKQHEEFEPFINQATSMISEGAFRAARELCDQMLRRDEAYKPARDCRDRADAEMSRQAKSEGGEP